MRMLDNENMTLEDAGFMDEDSLLAEIRSRYSWLTIISNSKDKYLLIMLFIPNKHLSNYKFILKYLKF